MQTGSKWYLIQCKPKQSFRAESNLTNQGYQCFHPTYPIKKKYGSVMRTIFLPLFPHYLFVLLHKLDNWSKIRSTRGVSKFVHFNHIPASLDNHLIAGLMQQCAKLYDQPPEPIIKPGQPVLISAGCFKELQAIVTAVTGEERVTLLIKLFNRQQKIELSINDVEVA